MKQCFKCKKEKPLNEFYVHPMMFDGHLNKCIDCTKKDVSERLAIKLKDLEWLALERARCRAKQARYRKLGLAIPSSPESSKQWASRNRHKTRAQNQARRAVLSGKINRKKKCEECGKRKKLHMHHADYSKPLNVQFLCHRCHGITRHK